MSVDATRWAWQQTGIGASRKMVLLAIADRCDDDHMAWPSISRLELDTDLDRKTIMSAIASLEADGLLCVERRSGGHSLYRLIGVEDRHATSTKNGTSTVFPMTSTKNGTAPVPKTGHEPKKNLPRTYQGETVRRARVREDCSAGTSADPLFEKFWRAYPRKCSKGQAERAFAKINPDEQLTAEIIAGIERAMTLDSRFLDGGYIPHPATWLNAKGWMDEFDQGPAKPATSSAYAGNKSRTQSKASDNASAVQEAIARFQRRQNLIDGECYEIN